MPEAQMKMIKRANDHKHEMMLTCLKYCCSVDNGAQHEQAAKNFLRVQDLPANFEENEKSDWRLADNMNVTQTMLHRTLRGTKMLTEGCVKHAVKL